MTPLDKKYIEYWKKARSKWNWGKAFTKGVIYIAWPIILVFYFVNYLIIGDTNNPYISLAHFLNLIFTLIWLGALIGFVYGFLSWTIKEQRYCSILKKDQSEQ